MSRSIGLTCAIAIANLHEDANERAVPPQPLAERQMDQNNNFGGRTLSSRSGSCAALSQDAIDNSYLTVINK